MTTYFKQRQIAYIKSAVRGQYDYPMRAVRQKYKRAREL